MNFRFEPYCENCEFVEPVVIKKAAVLGDTGERIGPDMIIRCSHERLCKRLHHHIEVVERAKNCSDEGLSPGNLAYVRQLEREEMMANELLNCSDEGSQS